MQERLIDVTLPPRLAFPFAAQLLSQTPPQSGWLDELDRLKGGWSMVLGVARLRAL
jgi:hypothetical protein